MLSIYVHMYERLSVAFCDQILPPSSLPACFSSKQIFFLFFVVVVLFVQSVWAVRSTILERKKAVHASFLFVCLTQGVGVL